MLRNLTKSELLWVGLTSGNASPVSRSMAIRQSMYGRSFKRFQRPVFIKLHGYLLIDYQDIMHFGIKIRRVVSATFAIRGCPSFSVMEWINLVKLAGYHNSAG